MIQKVIESRSSDRQNIACLVAVHTVAGSPTGRTSQTNEKPAMTKPSRIHDSSADQLPSELIELGRLVGEMELDDRREIETAFERVAESVLRRRRILNLVQEALAQLRLDVKYLMFDLELTRKERDELQARMEEEDPGF